MKSKNRYIDNLKDLVDEYLKEETISSKLHKTKRGVLNFMGDISKIKEFLHISE
jgi:hypothetical protein